MWSRALSRPSLRGAAASSIARCRTSALCTDCGCCTAARHYTSNTVVRSLCARPAATLSSSAALWTTTRRQSTLQKLLEDPTDPYLAALQSFDIPRIAAVVDEGPTNTAVPAAFLQRMGIRVDNDVAAARRAEHAAPTPLTMRRAKSSAEAVLQSLHAAGAERQVEAEAAEEEERRTAQAVYDALSSDEKAALQRERAVSHLFDGVCAISAAIRMQAEEGQASPEEMEAVYHVYETAMRALQRGDISAERWAADFAAEMAELEVLWKHLGSPRPLPVKE